MVAIVQTATPVATGGSASLSLTFGSPVTAGNLVAVLAGTFNFSATETFSGVTLGGSADHFALAKRTNASFLPSAEIWYDPNCAGGSTAIVATATGGSAGVAAVARIAYEISGLFTSGTLDKTTGAGGTSGSWSSGSTATTTAAAEIWLGCYAGVDSSGKTVTGPGSPWTSATALTATASSETLYWTAGYQIVSAAGAAAFAGSQNDSGGGMHWEASVATLIGTTAPAATGSFFQFFA